MVPRPKRDAAANAVPPSSPKRARKQAPEAQENGDEEFAIDQDELGDIMKVMGIAAFSTTKNKDHSKSDCFGVMKAQTRKTRQMVKPRTGTAK